MTQRNEMELSTRDKEIIQVALGFMVGLSEHQEGGKEVVEFMADQCIRRKDIRALFAKALATSVAEIAKMLSLYYILSLVNDFHYC
jgi:hypothetical protein